MRIAPWVLLVIVVGGSAAYFVQVVRKTEIPQRLLLCQLHQGKQEIRFVCPTGDHFDFTIGVPTGQKLPPKIAGKVLFVDESNSVPPLLFTTDNSSQANWLESKHLDAYIITWPTNAAPVRLDKQLISGKPVPMSIEINSPLEGSASLWLTYLAPSWSVKH